MPSKKVLVGVILAILGILAIGAASLQGGIQITRDGGKPPEGAGQTITLTEGQRDGPLLVQTIYPDYITGLRFMEYPVARDEGSPITMRIGDSVSNGCTVTLTLTKIEGKKAIFSKVEIMNRPCPIT